MPHLAPVSLNGTYFSRQGERFLPVGAHWIPAEAALQWAEQWDPDSIEADFAKMKDLGFNTVRFDLFWAWFEPRPGDYNPAAFDQLEFLIGMAHKYQIYLHPVLFIGGEVGEAFWDVPWRQGRHPHADPEMLRLQTDHAAFLAKRFCGESAILGWDLTDEPPYWIAGEQTSDAMAINWTRLIAGALRRYDPDHPLCVGTSQEDLNHGPFRPDTIAAEVDFFSAHPYSIYMAGLFPDPMLSERGTYCGAFQTLLSSGAGRPVMIHELGASSAQYSPERVAAFDRATMYSSLAAGANGFLLWCFTDAAPATYRKSPYLRAPHETQFGLTTWDRRDRPNGVELRRFSQVVAQMDLTGIEPEAAQAAVIVPHEWSKPHGDSSRLGLGGPSAVPYASTQDGSALTSGTSPWGEGGRFGEANQWITGAWLSTLILLRRAGLKTVFAREYADWQTVPLTFLPSPLTSTELNPVHIHTRFWEEAAKYVRQGGALYASLCADAAIPEMAELFGARLADHAPVEQVELKIVASFGGLQPGETFHYQPQPGANLKHWPAMLDITDGEVIAVDQDGRPALIKHDYGEGRTLLCAYPLESYLAVKPAAFEGEAEQSCRLYEAFRRWAGVQPLFHCSHPKVEVAGLVGRQRGYAVLASHSEKELQVKLTTGLPIQEARLLAPDGAQDLSLDGTAFSLTLEGYGGAVVEWTI